MDDDLLRARFRALEEPVEPSAAFVSDLHGQLAARLGFVSETAVDLRPRRRARAIHRRRWLLLAATIALVVALLGNIAGVGSLIRRTITGPTLEDTVRSSGLLRIAVAPDAPQVIAPAGGMQGFDIDVANALGARLGVAVELVVLPVDEMFAPVHRDWQVAMPGTSRATGSGDYVETDAYYRWPVYVLGSADAETVGGVGGLAGKTVCVVDGSAGERWLDPAIDDGSLEIAEAPPDVVTIRLADDDACLADIAAGRSSAMVTDGFLASDVPTTPGIRLVGAGPVALEPRTILVPEQLAEAEAFAQVLDRVLSGMRADGTLSDLSKRRFGGNDLTAPAP